MYVQSCCFANQTYCFFAVHVAVSAVVAYAPYREVRLKFSVRLRPSLRMAAQLESTSGATIQPAAPVSVFTRKTPPRNRLHVLHATRSGDIRELK